MNTFIDGFFGAFVEAYRIVEFFYDFSRWAFIWAKQYFKKAMS